MTCLKDSERKDVVLKIIDGHTMIKIIAVAAIILLLLCVALNISFDVPSSGRGHTKGRAISDFEMIETAYRVDASIGSGIDIDFLKKNQERLNAELTKMLELEIVPRYLSSDGEFLDPWGTPYHIRIDFDTEPVFNNKGIMINKGEIILGGKKIKKRIIVWSSGPNKINEFGKGDDIKSW